MGTLIDFLFQAPSMPNVGLPEHIAGGIISVIQETYRIVYLRGVYDGFVAGCLFVFIFLPRLRD